MVHVAHILFPSFNIISIVNSGTPCTPIPTNIPIPILLCITEEFYLLQSWENQSHIEERNDLWSEQGRAYAQLFIKLLSIVKTKQVTQYVLTLLVQILDSSSASGDKNKAAVFHTITAPSQSQTPPRGNSSPSKPSSSSSSSSPSSSSIPSVDPCSVLMSIIQRSDDDSYSQLKALHILSIILSAPGAHPSSYAPFNKWLMKSLGSSSGPQLAQSLTALKNISKHPLAQIAFVRGGGISSFVGLLKKDSKSSNTSYSATFSLWVMSNTLLLVQKHCSQICDVYFTDVAAAEGTSPMSAALDYIQETVDSLLKNDIIGKLVDIVRHSNREKLVRIGLATLHNYIEFEQMAQQPALSASDEKDDKDASAFVPAAGGSLGRFTESMIGHGLAKVVKSLIDRKWKDSDVNIHLVYLNRTLSQAVKELSNFDMYHAEVVSGSLQRGPVHTEEFWRENYTKFENNSFEVVKHLVTFLDSADVTTVELACFDLGEFARFHPDGKRVLQKFNAKERLMLHMQSPESGISKQALLCVQKLMVKSWETLSKSKGTVTSL